MLKHIYLILIATFIFGFITGIILWLLNHTGQEKIFNIENDIEEGMSIIARSYGGCDWAGCPSYRIDEDGDYAYILRNRQEPEIRNDGSLEKTELRLLADLLDDTNLEIIEGSDFSGTCPIAYDGIGYKYVISYEGDSYSFDSCKEDIEGEKLFDRLESYFKVFEPHGSM